MHRLRGLAVADGGQAAIEFAVAAILLIIIVLGIFDIGRAVWWSNTLSLATREGARYAIVHGSLGGGATEADIASVVQGYLVGVTSTVTTTVSWCATDPCASPDPTANSPGDYVTVTSTTPYAPFASNFFAGAGWRVTLTGSTTMVIRQ